MESVKRMDGAKRIENLVDRLAESHILSREEFCFLLDNIEPEGWVSLWESKETGAGQLREPCFRPWAD